MKRLNKLLFVVTSALLFCGCETADIPTKPHPSVEDTETITDTQSKETTTSETEETTYPTQNIPVADITLPYIPESTEETTEESTEESTEEPTESKVVVTSMEVSIAGKKHYIGDVLSDDMFTVYATFSDGTYGPVTDWVAYPRMLCNKYNDIHIVKDDAEVVVTLKAVFRPAIKYDKRIVCIGDSLTEGAGGGSISYRFVLQNYLDITKRTYEVINRGGGGELSYSILARMGATPIYVKDFTLPETSESVEVTLFGEPGSEGINFCEALRGVNTCTLNGIACTLQAKPENGQMKYYIMRNDPGEEVEIKNGVIIPNAAVTETNAEIYICWLGTNNRYYPTETHLAYQKRLQNYLGDRKVLFLGLTCPDTTKINDVSRAYWGPQFLDLKERLLAACLVEPRITLTEEDYKRMERGELPGAIMYDEVHLNSLGYEMVGKIVFEYLQILGWI